MTERLAVCCVCGHALDHHVSEKDVWRCHCLGADLYQCECALRKNRSKRGISYYDFRLRRNEMREEVIKCGLVTDYNSGL